jgi:phage virion morphogenesis protein
MQRRGSDFSPALRIIGGDLISSIEENFQREGRYASAGSMRGGTNRWEPLRPSTRALREKAGKWPGKILQVSGHLAASITKEVSATSLILGSNLPYAAIHQLGGQAGRGRNVTIPARPYLVIQDEDLEDIIDILTDYLMEE